MKLRILLSTLSFALTGACGTLPVRTSGADAAPGVDAAVVVVHSGGQWSEGEAVGEYRIIVEQTGIEHLHSRLFVQWIEHRQTGARIRATAAISEVNDPNVWSFRDVRLVGTENEWRLRVPVTNTYSLAEGEFEIQLGAPGQWRVLRSAVPDTS